MERTLGRKEMERKEAKDKKRVEKEMERTLGRKEMERKEAKDKKRVEKEK